jgi:hypothetical protein
MYEQALCRSACTREALLLCRKARFQAPETIHKLVMSMSSNSAGRALKESYEGGGLKVRAVSEKARLGRGLKAAQSLRQLVRARGLKAARSLRQLVWGACTREALLLCRKARFQAPETIHRLVMSMSSNSAGRSLKESYEGGGWLKVRAVSEKARLGPRIKSRAVSEKARLGRGLKAARSLRQLVWKAS